MAPASPVFSNELVIQDTKVLSSTADHLYWMARSMERAENTARMLDVTYRMSLLTKQSAEPQEWRAMLSISGLHEDFATRYPECSADSVLHFMTLDAKNPGSIYTSVLNARENARAVREIRIGLTKLSTLLMPNIPHRIMNTAQPDWPPS